MNGFIQIRNVRKVFVKSGFLTRKRLVRAVDGVSLTIKKGETLGLVGESGSGKTTLGRILAGLEEPDEGEILIGGTELREYLRKNRVKVQMIHQNPGTALNPRHKVRYILKEALEASGHDASPHRIREILADVGLTPDIAGRYPHELSGGQKQRVAIARAIAVEPDFIIADEIVSALDATIKVRILRLIKRLQGEHGFSMLFISHDLPITASVSDNIAVMYRGKIVEYGPAKELMYSPMHPYTAHLVSSVPSLYYGSEWKPIALKLRNDDQDNWAQAGCPLYHRCPLAVEGLCDVKEPEPVRLRNRFVLCHRPLTGTDAIKGESHALLTKVLSR